MLVNATLFMQAVHFLIAYGMLHFFLLKPAYAVIAREDEAERKHHATVADHKKAIEQAEKRMREEWQACRDYFEQHKPTLPGPREFVQPRVPLTVTMPSDKQLKELKHEVEDFIVSKVTHVS